MNRRIGRWAGQIRLVVSICCVQTSPWGSTLRSLLEGGVLGTDVAVTKVPPPGDDVFCKGTVGGGVTVTDVAASASPPPGFGVRSPCPFSAPFSLGSVHKLNGVPTLMAANANAHSTREPRPDRPGAHEGATTSLGWPLAQAPAVCPGELRPVVVGGVVIPTSRSLRRGGVLGTDVAVTKVPPPGDDAFCKGTAGGGVTVTDDAAPASPPPGFSAARGNGAPNLPGRVV